MSTKATEVVEILVHDLWRWMATLDAIAATEWDDGNIQTAQQLRSIRGEWCVLVAPEEE